jgi:hypothetical protein
MRAHISLIAALFLATGAAHAQVQPSPPPSIEYKVDVCVFSPTAVDNNLDNCATLSHATLAGCEWVQQKNAPKHGLTVIRGCRKAKQEEKK